MPDRAQATPAGGVGTELVGTRTFLLTDVVGSTALWAADAARASVAIARHYEVVDAAVRRSRGVRPLEQGEGDSAVAVFERATDAVAAAVEIHRTLATEPWDGAAVEVRIGIHTGDAELRDGTTWVGMALNRCARLRALAHGGQVLLSSAAAGILADATDPDMQLVDLGEHELRGVARRERVYQLVHPELRADFPDLRPDSPSGVRLPTYLTSFVGRTGVIEDLAGSLDQQRCLTLSGSGGCGKTRLAHELARHLSAAHPDRVHWADLAALADPALVPMEVAQAVGATTLPAVDVVGAIVRHLDGPPAVLVLDNCEHLVSAAASLADSLLQRCLRLRVIVTTREPLGLPGERTWGVPSLSVPGEGAGPAEVVGSESGQLFLERAGGVRTGFRVDAGNAAAVANICRRLDGIPLAIELAAARTRSLSPQDILDGLDDRFALLTGGPRTAMARQRTLEASVSWSHELLTPEERVMFRRLAVFAGGFTLVAAEDVCASADLPELAVLDVLSRLVERSLVVVQERPGGSRYQLLETLRDFARHRLSDAGEATAVRERHLQHFLARAEAAAPDLESQRAIEVADELHADLDNFRAAADWSIDAGLADEARRLTYALNPFFFHHNLPVEYRQRLERIRALDGGSLRPRALHAITLLASHMLMFDPVGADDDIEAAFALVRELDEPVLLARALMWGGWLRALDGAPSARGIFEEAMAVAGDVDPLSQGLALVGRSFLDVFDADLHAADAALTRAEALYAGSRCPIDGYPTTMFFRTIAEVGRARLPTARTAASNLERWVEDMPRNWFRPLAGLARGYVELAAGRPDLARAHLTEALDLATHLGNPLQYVFGSNYLGQALLAAGATEEARQVAGTTVALLEVVDGGQFSVPSLAALARAAIEDGDRAGASTYRDRLRTIGNSPEGRYARAWADRIDAHLAASEGELRQAEHHLHAALGTLLDGGVDYDVLAVLDALAATAAQDGSAEEAARVSAAVDAARSRLGVPRWPLDEPEHERTLEVARHAVGDRWAELWEQGTAMTLEEVAAYVRRMRGQRGRPPHGWESLTPTEQTVVELVTEGLTNPQIAERLFVARGTVRTHLTHIFRKVGVATRAELAARAVRRGARSDTAP